MMTGLVGGRLFSLACRSSHLYANALQALSSVDSSPTFIVSSRLLVTKVTQSTLPTTDSRAVVLPARQLLSTLKWLSPITGERRRIGELLLLLLLPRLLAVSIRRIHQATNGFKT